MSTIDFESIATGIGKLVASKNKSYGNSFQESGKIIGMLYPNGIPVEKYTSVLALVRIIDKLYRIATQPDFNGEDAWRDIAGYAILMSGYEDAKRVKDDVAIPLHTAKFNPNAVRLDEIIPEENKTPWPEGALTAKQIFESNFWANPEYFPPASKLVAPKPSPAMEEWIKSSVVKDDGLKGIDTSNVAKELTDGIEVHELVEKLVENQMNLKSQADLADTIFNNTYATTDATVSTEVNTIPESNQDLTDSGIK